MEENKRFEVADLDSANWALRKISELKQEIDEKQELAEKELHRIQSWLDKETDPLCKSIEYFEFLLHQYYVEEKRKNPKFKISTPYGKVSSRKRQPKFDFDEEKTLEYFRQEKPELIQTKETFNKNEAKKVFQPVKRNGEIQVVDENGQPVDFVKVTPQEEVIIVKTD